MSETTELKHATLVTEGIVTGYEDGSRPGLVGVYCPDCARWYFPCPSYCRSCLEPVQAADLGGEGKLHAFTVIRMRPPLGLPQPYAVGYVDLKESGLRVFCLLDPSAIDRYRLDMPLRLTVSVLGHDGSGQPCLRPYFSPGDHHEDAEKETDTGGGEVRDE